MRELYNEFFYIPKHGKVREKVMLARVTITIVIMVVCLVAMSLTAYAYFSYNVTSGSNMIKAANFDAEVSIIKDSSNEAIQGTKENNIYTAKLGPGTYTVELTKGQSTAKTGFCIVTIGETIYHTQQIGVDGEVKRLTLTFTLDLTEISGVTDVKFTPHWGTSNYYGYENLDSNPLYIKNEGSVKITAGASSSVSESDEKKETTSYETSPTETTGTDSTEQTQPATENTETTGASNTEASE